MSRILSRRLLLTSLAGCAAAMAAACAAPAAPTSAPAATTAPKPGATAKPATSAQPTPATQAPGKPAQLTPVKMVQVIAGLSFAPVYIARNKNYFAEEGIDLDWSIVTGGSPSSAALSSGDVQFSAAASADLITAVGNQLPFLGVTGIATASLFQMVVSKKFAESRGVTASSPLDQKIDALKGGTFGTASLGGAPDRFTRWLMLKRGYQLTDVEVLRVGGGPELLVATREGQIDGFLLSPPWGAQAEKEGFGIVLINLGTEVPEFQQFVQQVLLTRKDYAESNADVVRRVSRAVVRGSKLISENFDEAVRVLQQELNTTPPDLVEASMKATKDAFPPDGRMTEAQWANTIQVLRQAEAINQPIDAKEGVWWTSRFL